MSKNSKPLTVAIAGALVAPMAAHAVDFTVSGHVNRAIFITDLGNGNSTFSSVKDNGNSGTRIRVKGTGEMMAGGSAGVLLEYSAGSSLALRYADLRFSGDFGKVSIGHGDQGGDGPVYHGSVAALETGQGQDTNGVASNYYASLDGGHARNERLRYETPAIGPISAAVSIGNGDIQWSGNKFTVSASAGATLDSGLAVSGAWGKMHCPWPPICPPCPPPPCPCPSVNRSLTTDPSFFQMGEIGYKFGNIRAATSWYDLDEGSEVDAIGVGERHILPKAGINLHATVPNYGVEHTWDAYSALDTVLMNGNGIKF